MMRKGHRLYNPFVFGKPLTSKRERLLYWRDSYATGIEQEIIKRMRNAGYCAVLGPHCSGKSSLVLSVLSKIKKTRERSLFLGLDARNLKHDSLSDLYGQMLSEIQSQASHATEHKARRCPNKVTATPEGLERVLIELASKGLDRLHLWIDHIENLPFEMAKSIAICLRNIHDRRVGERPVVQLTGRLSFDVAVLRRLSVLVSGSRSLYRLTSEPDSPLIVAASFKLRDFEREAAMALVRRGFELAKVSITQGALDSIYDATQGDRYFIQKICFLALEAIKAARTRKVTKWIVFQKVRDIIEGGILDVCLARAVLLLRADPHILKNVLEICSSREVIRLREKQTDVDTLELTGAIKIVDGHYEPRNQIYEMFLKKHFDAKTITEVFAIDDFHKVALGCRQDRQVSITVDSEGCISVVTPAGVYPGCGSLAGEENESLTTRAEENIPAHLRSASDGAARKEAKDVGCSFYKQLFHAGGVVRSLGYLGEEALSFQFRGSRTSLRVPFELLHDEQDYIVLKNPVARLITGVSLPREKREPFPLFAKRLRAEGKKLRILVIASNAPLRSPWIDKEAEELKEVIERDLCFLGIRHEVDMIPSTEATYDRVAGQLRSNKLYHILHFAGHGKYDDSVPERSCIILWRDRKGKEPVAVRTRALKELLESPHLRLCYFSCCEGARTQERAALSTYDFLGIFDAAVLAGVPSVIGFRWPILDEVAKDLAIAFYRRLFSFQGQTTLSIENSLYFARREVAEGTEASPVWVLSPILVSQFPFPV